MKRSLRGIFLVALAPLLASCVNTWQKTNIACSVVQGGTVTVFSSFCDGYEMDCGASNGFQKISVVSWGTPAFVTVKFSDGSSEEVFLNDSIGKQWLKPLGTGVKVEAQC